MWFSLQVSLELKRQHNTTPTWFRNVNQSPHRKFFSSILPFFSFLFLAVDFCRFCVLIRFFHPRQYVQWPPTSKDFYTRSYPLHYFLNLILEKEPVFPFLMLSAKQGNYCYHFYNVFGMTRCLTGDWNRDLPDSMPVLYQYVIDESLSNHESANKLYYTNGHLNHNGNMYIIILNTTCMWVFYLLFTVFACGLVLFDSIR